MTDETNPPAGVPLGKGGARTPGRTSGPGSDPAAPRPRLVTYAFVALIVAGIFGLLTAAGWATQRTWVKHELGKANSSAVASAVSSATKSATTKKQDVAKASASASSSAIKKHPVAGKKLSDQANQQVTGTFVGSLFEILVCGFLAYGAYRGRHWTRWAVTGFFVLATFTGIGIGLLSLINGLVASGVPAAVRIPSLVAGLAMVIAVVLVNLRPSAEYFALSRPAPRPGAPQRRGLFSRPVPPPRGAQPQRAASGPSLTKRPAESTPAADAGADAGAVSGPDRARAKKRATSDAVARGAELARTRAKASKSRRSTDR